MNQSRIRNNRVSKEEAHSIYNAYQEQIAASRSIRDANIRLNPEQTSQRTSITQYDQYDQGSHRLQSEKKKFGTFVQRTKESLNLDAHRQPQQAQRPEMVSSSQFREIRAPEDVSMLNRQSQVPQVPPMFNSQNGVEMDIWSQSQPMEIQEPKNNKYPCCEYCGKGQDYNNTVSFCQMCNSNCIHHLCALKSGMIQPKVGGFIAWFCNYCAYGNRPQHRF